MQQGIPFLQMSTRRRQDAVAGYLFILPWLLGFLIFVLGPVFVSLYFSFTDYEIVRSPTFTGLRNFELLLADRLFWQALKVSSIYVGVSVPLGLVFSFSVALLMNQKVRWIGLWRTIYYIPTLVPVIASTMLWLWIFNPQFGLLNMALRLVGIEGPLWLGHSQWALPSLIIMSLWTVGAPMLIYPGGSARDTDGSLRGRVHGRRRRLAKIP